MAKSSRRDSHPVTAESAYALPGTSPGYLKNWIRRVDQYEFCRDVRISTPSDPSIDSELQRLVRRAFQTYADGDISWRTYANWKRYMRSFATITRYSHFLQNFVSSNAE